MKNINLNIYLLKIYILNYFIYIKYFIFKNIIIFLKLEHFSKIKKMNEKYFYILLVITLFHSYESYVLLNLKKVENETEKSMEYSPQILINNLYSKYYGLLNVGYPKQKTEVHFSLDYFGLSFKENSCYTSNYFDKNKSITISQTYDYNTGSLSKRTVVVSESIEFPVYNTSANKIAYSTIPSYILIYNKDTNETKDEEYLEKRFPAKACLIYGFKLFCPQNSVICNGITYSLRKKGLTKSDNFHYVFYDEKEKKTNGGYDVALVVGENPHEYDKNKFKNKEYLKTNAQQMILEHGWIFEFKNYYYLSNGTIINFGITSSNFLVKGWLRLELNIIIGIKEYLNSIKRHYFDLHKKECTFELVDSRYTVYYCDVNFDTKDFPTIYFQNIDFNYTFELTHKDLFEIRGNRKYFLVVFDKVSNYPWKFGKLFMKKYFFNFETESKQIGFYVDKEGGDSNDPDNPNNKDNPWNLWKWILFAGIIVVVGVLGFYIGNKIKNKNRRKRANELDDDEYEYKQKKEKDKKEALNEEQGQDEQNSLGIN